jgi:hypothetical protein
LLEGSGSCGPGYCQCEAIVRDSQPDLRRRPYSRSSVGESSSSYSSARSAYCGGTSWPSDPDRSSRSNDEKSVSKDRYFSSRATFVCFAFARPRPIGSTPSHVVCLRLAAAQMVNVVRERLPNGPKGAKPRHPIPQRVGRTGLPAQGCRHRRRSQHRRPRPAALAQPTDVRRRRPNPVAGPPPYRPPC